MAGVQCFFSQCMRSCMCSCVSMTCTLADEHLAHEAFRVHSQEFGHSGSLL